MKTKTTFEGEIDLKELVVDYEWNARSGAFWLDGSADPHGNGYQGLKADIEAIGQTTSVIGRIIDLGGGKFELRLVDGYRRVHAITALYAEGKTVPGLEPGQIRIDARVMSDFEARELNIAANAHREGNKEQDIGWAAHELFKLGASWSAIERAISKDKELTHDLVTVFAKLPTKITNAWRCNVDLEGRRFGFGVPLASMVELAEACPPDLQEQQYTVLYYAQAKKNRRKNPQTDEGCTKRQRDWCKKRGKDLALIVTIGEQAGALKVLKSLMDDEFWRKAVKRKGAGWSDERLMEMARVAKESFLGARAARGARGAGAASAAYSE